MILVTVFLSLTDEPEWPAEQRGEFFGFISGKTNLTCEANAEPPAQVRDLINIVRSIEN